MFLGLNLDTGELMAVKQIDVKGISETDLALMQHEVKMVEGLSHENIVRYAPWVQRRPHEEGVFGVFWVFSAVFRQFTLTCPVVPPALAPVCLASAIV